MKNFLQILKAWFSSLINQLICVFNNFLYYDSMSVFKVGIVPSRLQFDLLLHWIKLDQVFYQAVDFRMKMKVVENQIE